MHSADLPLYGNKKKIHWNGKTYHVLMATPGTSLENNHQLNMFSICVWSNLDI